MNYRNKMALTGPMMFVLDSEKHENKMAMTGPMKVYVLVRNGKIAQLQGQKLLFLTRETAREFVLSPNKLPSGFYDIEECEFMPE